MYDGSQIRLELQVREMGKRFLNSWSPVRGVRTIFSQHYTGSCITYRKLEA